MASTRVEEVFVANYAFGNGSTLGIGTNNVQTNTFINGIIPFLDTPLHNIVGLMNDDTKTLIVTAVDLSSSRYVRFFMTHRGRIVRYSDRIDRRKITRIDRSFWSFYHPVVYRLDFSGANTVQAGDRIVLGFQLKQEEDMSFTRQLIEHTFKGSGTNINQDIVDIVNKINAVAIKLTKNTVPFKAFTGTLSGGTIDFTEPNGANKTIFIIAGKRQLDKQNIRQLTVYDFDVLEISSYDASTNNTVYGTFTNLFPSYTKQRGTIGNHSATYNYNSAEPIIYNSDGEPINKGAGGYTFLEQSAGSLSPKRISNQNGFYENIISHLYQEDFGKVLGHQNRVWLPDEIEIPNIRKDILTLGGGSLDITNRYNAIHIEYYDDALDSTFSPQNVNFNKRFTLYYNATLEQAGNINVNSTNYPTLNWNAAADGLRNLTLNLRL